MVWSFLAVYTLQSGFIYICFVINKLFSLTKLDSQFFPFVIQKCQRQKFNILRI